MTIIILLAIISLGLLFWQISNLASVIYGSPPVMANKEIIRGALKLSKIKKGETFYDLGCGRGDVLIEAARMGAKAVGFEISPYYYLYAKIRVAILKLLPFICSSGKKGVIHTRIIVRYVNINFLNLSKADVVYCYLLPGLLEKLSHKFLKELKKNSRIISVGFPIKKLSGTAHTIAGHKIYLYNI